MAIDKIKSSALNDSLDFDTNTLVVDGVNNRVGIGGAPETDFHIHGGDESADVLRLDSTLQNQRTNHAPEFAIKRLQTTPADGDFLGALELSGNNSAGTAVTYGRIAGVAKNVTDGTEDGEIRFAAQDNSSVETKFFINNNGVGVSVSPDGVTNGVSTQAPDLTVQGETKITRNNTSNTDLSYPVLTLESTSNSSAAGPDLNIIRNSTSPANADGLGRIGFFGKNSAAETVKYASIDTKIKDVTDGTENSFMSFNAIQGGNMYSWLEYDGTVNEVVVNQGANNINFRVEAQSGRPNLLFCDAGEQRVFINSDLNGNIASNTVLCVSAGDPDVPMEIYRATNTATDNMFFLYSDVGGTQTKRLEMEANGDIHSTTGTYGTFSDLRLKQDITPATEQWEDIKAIQFKNYKLKTEVADPDTVATTYFGVIAQDLEASGMGGLVSESRDDETDAESTTTKSVKTSVMLMKAVKALQEAMTKIETLETKVATLENA